MQTILILAVVLILAVLGQIPLLIFFAMGVACVLIVRHGICSYEQNKAEPQDPPSE